MKARATSSKSWIDAIVAGPRAQPAGRPPRDRRAPTIVVADGDPAVCTALTYLLGDAYGVRAVDRAQRALEACARYRPDLLLVDFALPDMDAIALVAELRARGSETPAIMLSEHPRHREASLRAGFDAFLGKPWDNSELAWRIERALRPAMRGRP